VHFSVSIELYLSNILKVESWQLAYQWWISKLHGRHCTIYVWCSWSANQYDDDDNNRKNNNTNNDHNNNNNNR